MIQFIVFSRKRPLQLYGYLESIFRNISDQIAVSVLVKIDDHYAAAYAEVQERFPYVHFRHETEFTKDLHYLLDRSAGEYVSFGCDDVLFTGSIKPDDVAGIFGNTNLLGISLRLGRSVTIGMFGEAMPYPMFKSHEGHRFMLWDVGNSQSGGDWAYPWEVLGTIYPRLFVEAMLGQMKPNNPSQLEDMGTRLWSSTTPFRIMACYPTQRIIVPTVNLVQTEFPGNGILGTRTLTPEFLLECWNNGLRMDLDRFARQAYSSWRVPEFYLRRNA